MKFEEDFDFETANAQFNKDEIDKELQSKLKLKGTGSPPPPLRDYPVGKWRIGVFSSVD